MVGSGLILNNSLSDLYALDFPASQERLSRGNVTEEQEGGAWLSKIVRTNLTVVGDL